jgi:nucleotide-binding universal stress UspA family protein
MTAAANAFIGSTSTKVLHRAAVPVLVLHGLRDQARA